MAFFLSKKSPSKIPIHHENIESSDPVLTDIIDLRKIKPRGGTLKTKPLEEIKEANDPKPAPSETRKKSRHQESAKEPKIISRYMQAATGQKTMHMDLPRDHRRRKLAWYAFGIVALAGGGTALLSIVFNVATIVIKPEHKEQPLSKVLVTVDPSLSLPDIDTRRIPGEQMQLGDDISLSFKATGKKYVETRARGVLTISNAFSSSPQTLVQSTRLQNTKTNMVYRLTASITVPGAKIENGAIVASTIDAAAQADGIGESYNGSEGEFVIPGFQGTPKFKAFTARIKEPFTGGYKGTTQVVTKEDLEKANISFAEESRASLRTKSGQNMLPGFMMIPSAEKFDIISKTAPKANDPAETFTIRGKARLTNITFQEKTLLEFLNTLVNKDTSRERSVLYDASKLIYDSAVLAGTEKLNLSISGTLATIAIVQSSVIQNAIANKPAEEAKNALRAIPAVGAFGIKLFPFWNSRIPQETSKIRVQIAQ